MPASPELFLETMDHMISGDRLMVVGGTFPGRNDATELEIGLGMIIPVLRIVTGHDEYAPHPNPLVATGEDDRVRLLVERGDKRFGHDYDERGPDITYGKAAGKVLDLTVDFWVLNPMTQQTFYFIGKAEPS